MATKGAMKLKGKAYRDRRVRDINKKRKLNKHLADNPNDGDANKAFKLVA